MIRMGRNSILEGFSWSLSTLGLNSLIPFSFEIERLFRIRQVDRALINVSLETPFIHYFSLFSCLGRGFLLLSLLSAFLGGGLGLLLLFKWRSSSALRESPWLSVSLITGNSMGIVHTIGCTEVAKLTLPLLIG